MCEDIPKTIVDHLTACDALLCGPTLCRHGKAGVCEQCIIEQLRAELTGYKETRLRLLELERDYALLQDELAEAKKLLTDALPNIECLNHDQSSLITVIGQFLEGGE